MPATLVRTTSKPQSCDRGSLPESASLMFFPVQKASQWRVNWSESHPWLFAAPMMRFSSASHYAALLHGGTAIVSSIIL